jgi:uncharacterized short protein YbdD (DUF466 family)
MEVRLRRILSIAWMVLRRLSGEDGYEAYLAHWRTHHPGAAPPTRSEWFREETRRRWSGGPRRCC